MKIKKITNYKGRYCAELMNGQYILSNGTFELMLCEKVDEGMKVIKTGIVGGIMMRTEDDFRWCVEHLDKEMLANDEEDDVEEDEARKVYEDMPTSDLFASVAEQCQVDTILSVAEGYIGEENIREFLMACLGFNIE